LELKSLRRGFEKFGIFSGFQAKLYAKRCRSLRPFQQRVGNIMLIKRGTPLEYLFTMSERLADSLLVF